MKNFKIYMVAGLLFLAACKPEINKPAPTKGKADFSRFIAVGNSLTAGYSNGGLYLAGQQNSYPSIMAKQMLTVGGGVFNQPLFSPSQANGSGYLELKGFDPTTGNPITDTVTTQLAIRNIENVTGFGPVILYTKYTGDIENYGVPGIKLEQITYAPLGNLNGYFERMLPTDFPNNITTDYLDFVTAKPFTFFSDWLGNNDALLYATEGGAGVDQLTDKATFQELYELSIDALTAKGAKGVVATIPDVTAIPYFKTVTVGAVLAGVQKQNPSVQALYINALVPGTTTYAPRVATSADLLVLSFPTTLIGTTVNVPGVGAVPYGLTPYAPIDNQYVLDAAEVAMCEDYVTSYNTAIKSIAAAKGLAIFDANTYLNDLDAHGLQVDGVTLTSAYISGGIFSLDGVHLTPRGYAIIANQFILAINKTYGSNIPQANVADYQGLKFP